MLHLQWHAGPTQGKGACRGAASRSGLWGVIGVVYIRLYSAHFGNHHHPVKDSGRADPHRVVCRGALPSHCGSRELHCAGAAVVGKRSHATRRCLVSQGRRGSDSTPGTLFYFETFLRCLNVREEMYPEGQWLPRAITLKRIGSIPLPDPSPSVSPSLTDSVPCESYLP